MFLLIDNYDSFTYNLAQAFFQLGEKPVVVCNDDPRLLALAENPQLEKVCISPGPGRPEDAGFCPEFLNRLPHDVPVLGVCLGHQLLAAHAGAPVVVNSTIMHGKASPVVHDGTGLFSGLPKPMTVGRYHSLVAEIPDDHPLLAVNARGPEGEVMGLRYRDRPWAGVQFHPESVLTPDGARLLGNFPQTILSPEKQADMPLILETLACGRDLSRDMAASAFARLMDGGMGAGEAAAFLMGLRAKGESPLELACAVQAAVRRAVRVDCDDRPALDVVGTGGDGKHSFNCSTAAALTLAGMGHRVIKHGNRAVSSTSGSADALENLGIPFGKTPEEVRAEADRRNFAFIFAPYFHPSFKYVGPVRRELGIRTLFNLLGPMINPARPSHLLMGVARPEMVPLMADTLRLTGVRRAAVVCGAGGYDEVTPLGAADVMLVDENGPRRLELVPSHYGIRPCAQEDLAVRSREEAASVLREILAGRGPQCMRDMVALNVGLGLFLLEACPTLDECMREARAAVDAGAAGKVLHAA